MKKLVVYFSYTNHTRDIAHKIAKELACDLLEIKTIIPYSSNYEEVVNDEKNSETSNYLPEIEKINIDLNEYDTIILGTPVWWYRPVPAIRTFLTNNALSNKKIIPFATNAGWLGKTFTEIKELCPDSTIEDGMNIVYKSYSDILKTSEEDINNWIDSL